MELSSLLNRFNEPETLKMAKLGRELRAKGIDVIDLSLGEPDFDTPQHIKEAAIKAINDNWSHYTPVAGFLDLREAVCTKLKRDNNLDYKPENIITSTGAKQSLANAILALVDEGDEVIIPTPYWVTYSELVKIARGKVVEIRTTVENKFKPTKQELEERIFNNSSWNNINFNSSYWYKNLRDYCDRDGISYYDITKGITFKLAPYKDGGK